MTEIQCAVLQIVVPQALKPAQERAILAQVRAYLQQFNVGGETGPGAGGTASAPEEKCPFSCLQWIIVAVVVIIVVAALAVPSYFLKR